jgi:hypothetical protein
MNNCVLVNEASSTQTAFFSYNHQLETNKIADKDKLSLKGCKIDDYALRGDAEGYFTAIFSNNILLKEHIISSNCSKFYWSLLATGGMRDLVDKHGIDLADNFYDNIKGYFAQHPQVCYDDVCKEVVLAEAKTISGGDEAYYAWITLNVYEESNCHAILDLGGQTGQFSNSSHSYSSYLGKERAILTLGNKVNYCYNHQSQYDGMQCRSNIQSYLEASFDNILSINHSQHCKVFAISNFYNYFNDICNSYLPYINDNNLNIDDHILARIKELCLQKNSADSMSLLVHSYKYITDEICAHWNDDWEGSKAEYARDACYTGNHNYQILKLLGIEEEHEIHAHSADWAPGAAMSILNVAI